MSTNLLKESRGVPADWVLSEKDDREVWAPADHAKVNPYSLAGRIKKSSKGIRGPADAKGQRWGVDYNPLKRSAPDDKGYTWSIGYNQLVGRYTQGLIFPELSGSSLNRKKNGKDVPTTARDIAALVDKTELQYRRRGIWLVPGWESGRKVSVGDILAGIYYELDTENIERAGELAVRFSLSLRKCPRAVSYGVHVLSSRSRGKIKDKATAFFRACPGNRVFGTFTFIAPVDDKTGQSILNKFLVQARKKFPTLQYFWVAERQESGNIHFHMILNKRLQVGRWNALWVLAQYNSGLRGNDQWGRELTIERLKELYALDQKEGFRGGVGKTGKKISRIQAELNPLDLRKIESIGALSGYLTKYITKQEKNKPFGCAVWHCSRRVSRMFTKQTVGPSCFSYMKSFANYGVNKETGEVWGEPTEYQPCAFAVVVLALNKAAPLRYLKKMELYNKHILGGGEITGLVELTDEIYRSKLKPQPCAN